MTYSRSGEETRLTSQIPPQKPVTLCTDSPRPGTFWNFEVLMILTVWLCSPWVESRSQAFCIQVSAAVRTWSSWCPLVMEETQVRRAV